MRVFPDAAGSIRARRRYVLQTSGTRRRILLALITAGFSLLFATISRGADAYDPSTGQLTIPTLNIGNATYSDVIVRIGSIVSSPTGTTPLGTVDTYNPASNLLTTQTVSVGATVYYNATATVASLVSIGSASGIDSYGGGRLSIPFVQDGSTIYTQVIANVATIVAVGGGMPTLAMDAYDQASNQLLIPAAVYLGRIYTNVVVTVANVVSVGGSGATGPGLANYIVTTLAGSGAIGAADGTGPAASFWAPEGVTVDNRGNVYVADTNNSLIREISPDGTVATIAGQGIGCFAGLPQYCDGPGPYASFYQQDGLTVDPHGTLIVADTNESVIRKISPSGFVSTLAGSNPAGSRDGPGLSASFYAPGDVAVDANGNVYVTDTVFYLIRKIAPDAQATVTTVATLPAQPLDIAADFAGNVYFTEPNANAIIRMTPAGVMSALAGSGYTGVNCQSADGQGASAQLCGPWGIAIDCIGNVYTSENNTGLIRMISPSGYVTTIAGQFGLGGNNLINGPGVLATFWGPEGIAVDTRFNLYVADSNNNMIRKLTPGTTGPLCSTILRSIAIEPVNPIVTPGHSLQLTAIGTYADGSSRDITSLVTWKTATPAVATVSPTGLATATLAGGTSLITASHGSATPGATTVNAAYTVGGSVNGLISGSSLVLQINGGETMTIRNNGPFTFPTPLANGTTYSVAISTPSASQPCSSLYGAAKVSGAPVSNIDVFCGPSTPNGGFSPAGAPLSAIAYQAATRLANGQVLVTGGTVETSGLIMKNPASTEIYDPSTDAWSAAANLTTGRQAHTATLLLNGKVLVVGGIGTNGYLASAELYDPIGDTWTSAASLVTARANHVATRLLNGRVLVVGGYNATVNATTAELYDPVTDTWSSAGTPGALFVQGFAAVLLPDGRVLVTGGGLTPSNAAQLYDPVANTWSAAASMANRRGCHSMNLLPDGTVLVSGGGGCNVNTPAGASAERYDPVTNTWSGAGSLATARERHTGTLLPTGQVLVAGGFTEQTNTVQDTAELYDPGSNSWSTTGTLTAPRYNHTATLLPDGEPLLVGGITDINLNELDSSELYW